MSAYTRALIILNPVSGRHDPDQTRAALESRFDTAQLAYELRVTEQDGDAFRWASSAADDGFDLVVAAGGDGTVMEAMSGLIKDGSRVPLAQVPVGTANSLAMALRIPHTLADAIEVIFSGKHERLDVGYLPREDRYFALVAGAGYDARVMTEASRELKNMLGIGAYVLSGIKNLFTLKRSRVTLEIDGQRKRLRAHTIMIANIGTLADGIAIGPDIDPHDGRLDLVIVTSETVLGGIGIMLRVLTRRFHGHSDLTYLHARRVRIDAHPPLPTQIDGEELGTTPLYAEAVQDGALLVVPQTYAPTSSRKQDTESPVSSDV